MIGNEAGPYSYEWISAENLSTEINLQAYSEEVFLIMLLKTVFENFNLVKSNNKTNPNDLYLVYGKNTGGVKFILASIHS